MGPCTMSKVHLHLTGMTCDSSDAPMAMAMRGRWPGSRMREAPDRGRTRTPERGEGGRDSGPAKDRGRRRGGSSHRQQHHF